MSKHGPTPKTYLVIYLALMALLVLAVLVTYLHKGWLGTFLAIAIGGAKATLIALYFMELRYSSRLTWVFAGAGVFWLGILVVLTMSDYLSRGWIPSIGR